MFLKWCISEVLTVPEPVRIRREVKDDWMVVLPLNEGIRPLKSFQRERESSHTFTLQRLVGSITFVKRLLMYVIFCKVCHTIGFDLLSLFFKRLFSLSLAFLQNSEAQIGTE